MDLAIPSWDQFRIDLRRALDAARGPEEADAAIADCEDVRRGQYADRSLRLWPRTPGRKNVLAILRDAFPDRSEGMIRRLDSLLDPPWKLDSRWRYEFEVPHSRACREGTEVAPMNDLWELLRLTGADLRATHFDPLDDLARVRVTRWGLPLRNPGGVHGEFPLASVKAALDAALSRTVRGQFTAWRRVAAMLAQHARCATVVEAEVIAGYGF